MLLTRNLLIAVMLASMLAVMLSIIPNSNVAQDRPYKPVFQTTQPMVLKDDNLVDILSLFPTRIPMAHVQWENNNLFIDFELDKDKPVYVDEVYDHLFSALESAYTLTNNINGLYIRIMYTEKGHNEVLIALSAERNEELVNHLGTVKNKKEFLQENTTLSYGVLWQENLRK